MTDNKMVGEITYTFTESDLEEVAKTIREELIESLLHRYPAGLVNAIFQAGTSQSDTEQ